jgi:hypothetical protein
MYRRMAGMKPRFTGMKPRFGANQRRFGSMKKKARKKKQHFAPVARTGGCDDGRPETPGGAEQETGRRKAEIGGSGEEDRGRSEPEQRRTRGSEGRSWRKPDRRRLEDVMSNQSKRGRPAGEVQVGEGFDEKLKRLADLFAARGWSFASVEQGAISPETLRKAAADQETDQQADRDAWSRFNLVHEPAMRRQGERGAFYSAALALARAAAKGNRELLRLIGELRIRSNRRTRSTPTPDKTTSA